MKPLGLAKSVLVIACTGCGTAPFTPLPNERTEPVDTGRFELLARFVHITDAHIADEESPARLTVAASAFSPAWRPHEAYSLQLLDGTIRTINKLHLAPHQIDFVIHTGDATDNAQLNELKWFVAAFDGGRIDPQSGPDDRDAASLPDPLLDPYHPFDAQGLYRNAVHGDAPTINWYGLLGNHDHFAVGVFPIVTDVLGGRISPLPLQERLALTFPTVLDPAGSLSFAPITPAHPGPPPLLSLPMLVRRNPARRYITDDEYVRAHLDSVGQPPGHGFDPAHADRTCYSVSPVPGLRLIGLNSASPLIEQQGLAYYNGAISLEQAAFLRDELERACTNDEQVVVATHHPSDALEATYGTALTPITFRQLLNAYPCVALHLAGHWHRNLVVDRGGYVEIVTSSLIDPPQQGRIIEIWRERPQSPSSPEPRGLARVNQPEPRGLARAESQWRATERPLTLRVKGRLRDEATKGVASGVPAGRRGEAAKGISTATVMERSKLAATAPRTARQTSLLSVFNPEGRSGTSRCTLRYWMFSHLDEVAPPDDSHTDLFDDPLLPMRRLAAELAEIR